MAGYAADSRHERNRRASVARVVMAPAQWRFGRNADPGLPNGQSFRNSLGVRWGGSASSTSISSSGGRSPSHQVGMEG